MRSTTVAALRALGLELMILSGDRPDAVAPVAAALGIADWRGGLTPAEKIAAIDALKAQGRRVLMVGDGLNDAPALAAAHVSLSPISAADLTQAQADAVFLGERLAPVLDAVAIARRARRLMRQNLWLAVIYNAIAVPVAIAGLRDAADRRRRDVRLVGPGDAQCAARVAPGRRRPLAQASAHERPDLSRADGARARPDRALRRFSGRCAAASTTTSKAPRCASCPMTTSAMPTADSSVDATGARACATDSSRPCESACEQALKKARDAAFRFVPPARRTGSLSRARSG